MARSDDRAPRRLSAGLLLPLLAVLLAAGFGFWWTRPGARERHLQLRPIEQVGAGVPGSGRVEAQLRAALARVGVPLVADGRDLAIGTQLRAVASGAVLAVRFEDAREGRVVWRATFALPHGEDSTLAAAAAVIARTTRCGLAAFDTRRPPRPPAAIPPLFRRCEAAARVSRAAIR